jgi:hypothetical protein
MQRANVASPLTRASYRGSKAGEGLAGHQVGVPSDAKGPYGFGCPQSGVRPNPTRQSRGSVQSRCSGRSVSVGANREASENEIETVTPASPSILISPPICLTRDRTNERTSAVVCHSYPIVADDDLGPSWSTSPRLNQDHPRTLVGKRVLNRIGDQLGQDNANVKCGIRVDQDVFLGPGPQ